MNCKEINLAGLFLKRALCVVLIGLASVPGLAADSLRKIISGDRLRIDVVEAPEYDSLYPVTGDGAIYFPLIGRLLVAEQTTEQAAKIIRTALEKEFFKKATVRVEVAEFVEGNVLMLGAVRSPGILPFRGDEITTVLEAITKAGGFGENANGNDVRILRWKPGQGTERQIITVDVKKMLETLDFSNDQYLRPRDIVVVPATGTGEGGGEYLVLGQVGSPGFHPYSEGLDMIRAIAKAGGVGSDGKLNAARLLRKEAKGDYQAIPVDLSRLFGAADMRYNYPVMKGDIIFVPTHDQSAGNKIYLLGEVAQPGMKELPSDRQATLARTMLACGGVTKFGHDGKVKVLRTSPDGSKQTLVFDVGKILKSGNFEDDIPLQDEDVIIVPERVFSIGNL